MAIYTCPNCNKVSFKAKVCPHCGYRNPASSSAYIGCLIIIAMAVSIYLFLGSPSLITRTNTDPTKVPTTTVTANNSHANAQTSKTYVSGEWRLEVPKSVDLWWANLPGFQRIIVLLILAFSFVHTIARFKYVVHTAVICHAFAIAATIQTKNLFWVLLGIVILMSVGATKSALNLSQQSRGDS